MPICIHCATPIESLYMRYGKDHIVLSPCSSPICSPATVAANDPSASTGVGSPVVLADEYLEHDLPIVIIDLILAKPQAYRHLLFNRSSIFASPAPTATATGTAAATKGSNNRGVGWGQISTLAKRLFALGLVDAYIRWFYLCVQAPTTTPTTAGWMATKDGKGRLMTVVQRFLPMQAGMFFPSMFAPRSTGVQGDAGGRRVLDAVCSAVPVWSSRSAATQLMGADAMLPTLISYINVLVITMVEALALHLCVGLLTHLTTRYLVSIRPNTPQPSLDRTTRPPPRYTHLLDPLLASQTLLLSQLSPLILLLFVLLWSTKFPHHAPPDSTPTTSTSTTTTTTASTFNKGVIVWIIRTFLASLNAGVALATCLPTANAWVSKVAPAAILGAAWSAQALTSAALHRWLEQA